MSFASNSMYIDCGHNIPWAGSSWQEIKDNIPSVCDKSRKKKFNPDAFAHFVLYALSSLTKLCLRQSGLSLVLVAHASVAVETDEFTSVVLYPPIPCQRFISYLFPSLRLVDLVVARHSGSSRRKRMRSNDWQNLFS